MRNFKIITVTVLLLMLAGIVLFAIKALLPGSSGPGPDELTGIYHDDNKPADTNDLYSQQLKQVDGTIKVLGVSLYGEGTHRLEKDDKLVMILESDTVDLKQYEGKDVMVRGFVRDTVTGGQKIMKVQYLEAAQEAGMKPFNEVGYEFSFSYPSDWDVKKEQDKVTFSRMKGDKSETLMIVYQYPNVTVSLEAWLKDRDQNLYYKETQVKIGSLTGVSRTVENGDQKIIKTYLKEGKNAYEIRLVSQDEVVKNQYLSIIDYFKTSFSGATDQPANTDQPAVSPAPDASATQPAVSDNAPSPDQSATTATTTESYTQLPPLSAADVDSVGQKGYSSFAGRTITFDYPKSWYFSYLGDGKYGVTDGTTYSDHQQEISEDISRILIISGTSKTLCSDSGAKTIDTTTVTVCAREPGLKSIIDHITASIAKTEAPTP